MSKEEVYIDLSKLNSKQRKEIYELTNLKYDDYYNFLFFNTEYKKFDCVVLSNHELLEYKFEITYEQFINLISE